MLTSVSMTFSAWAKIQAFGVMKKPENQHHKDVKNASQIFISFQSYLKMVV